MVRAAPIRLAVRTLAPLVALIGCGDAGGSKAGAGAGDSASAVAGAGSSAEPVPAGASGASGGSTARPQDTAGTTPSPAGGSGGEAGSAAASDGGTGAPALDGGAPEPGTYPSLQAEQIGAPVMVASGFDLAESPLWDPCEQRLLFTDVTASVIHALDDSGEVTVFATDTSNANGIAFDVDGSLILAQMGGDPGHVARRARDGTITTLEPAEPTLHTPDDVIVRSDGTIYFSDGDFYPIGSLLGAFDELPVYALKPGSSLLESGGTVGGPNGVELSPDERTLYVSAYGDGNVVKFDVAADGTLSEGDVVLRDLGSPDSLCLDAAGNLYVGVSSGLHVARPDGTPVTRIPSSSSRSTTSCGFGGEDGTTLFFTTWTALYKIDGMPIPGQDYLVNRERVDCGP